MACSWYILLTLDDKVMHALEHTIKFSSVIDNLLGDHDDYK